jgi:hypothetical protein
MALGSFPFGIDSRRSGSRERGSRLAIWGWWQGRNLGDNWIKSIWAELFPAAVFLDTTQMSLDE